jgi:hypothetical protein
MSSPHLASSAAESRRCFKAGLPVKVAPGEPARIYSERTDGPGLTITRALGFFCLQEAVICEPDVANSSFEGVPGLILLASGGMCEHFGQNAGEAMLQKLAVDGGLLDRGPDIALQCLCAAAQQQWKTRHNTYCEDISGILIQWLGAGRTPATLTAVPQSSLQANPFPSQQRATPLVPNSPQVVTYQGHQNLSLAAQMRVTPSAISTPDLPSRIIPASVDGQNLSLERIKPIDPSGNYLPPRIVPASEIESANVSSQVLKVPEKTRTFLQAQPPNSTSNFQAGSKARVSLGMPPPAEEHQSLGSGVNFLQAKPTGRLTTVLE